MLVCPDCNHILTTEAIPTDAPGGMITFNRCPYCGGVWFNHFDINRFPTYHAIRLAGQAARGELLKLSGTNRCPHCGVSLQPLNAESVPDTVHIRTCRVCRGHWVSKKDLVTIKKHQDQNLIEAKLSTIPLPSIYAVLIPVLIIGLVSLSVPLTINRIRQTQESQIRARELLSTPMVIPIETTGKTRSALISFSTSQLGTSMLELRSSQFAGTKQLAVSTTPSSLHTIKLVDLTPNSIYSYRLIITDQNGVKTASSEYQFKTQ